MYILLQQYLQIFHIYIYIYQKLFSPPLYNPMPLPPRPGRGSPPPPNPRWSIMHGLGVNSCCTANGKTLDLRQRTSVCYEPYDCIYDL